jgi:SAM-dependent methyltransferase
MAARTGSYPIQSSREEIARLRIQADAMAPDAAVMLARIGVGEGWRCLELGCGCGGIADLLSARVGPAGRVVGLDADPKMLAAARAWAAAKGLGNVDFVEGDAARSGLARGAFDLVHLRFVLSTAGRADDFLAEAVALARPGGVLAVEEPDIETLHCFPPHPAWDRLRQALADTFDAIGGDVHIAQSLYRRFRALGLGEIGYRPFVVGFTHSDPMADYLPLTIESLRPMLIDRGLAEAGELDAAIAACRAHLAEPDTVSVSYLVAQVWGRTPGPSAAGSPGAPDRHASR